MPLHLVSALGLCLSVGIVGHGAYHTVAYALIGCAHNVWVCTPLYLLMCSVRCAWVVSVLVRLPHDGVVFRCCIVEL
jgi:hypothetical protein